MFDRVEKDNKVAYYLNMENPLIKQLQENLSDSDIIIFKALLKQIEEHLPLIVSNMTWLQTKDLKKMKIQMMKFMKR